MNTQEYYREKQEINNIQGLNEIQKHILNMELRTRYYSMSRFQLNNNNEENEVIGNHLDTSRIKSTMVQVVNKI